MSKFLSKVSLNQYSFEIIAFSDGCNFGSNRLEI
jgi:hypothetical protein